MRRTVTVLVVAAVAAGAWAVQRAVSPDGELLALPAPGEIQPNWLDDGLPVFVVRARDGGVAVFDARSPHRVDWWKLVGFCPSSGMFEDPWHGSRFDQEGRWRGGPAPHGLTPLRAEVAGEQVRVGEPLAPQARRSLDDPANRNEPFGPSCEGRTPAEALEAGLVTHEPALPAEVPWIDELDRGSQGWLAAAGTVVGHPGRPLLLCREASGEPPACDGGWTSEATVQEREPGLRWWRYDGRMLVLVEHGRPRDVVLLTSGRTAYRTAGVERRFGLADLVIDRDGGQELRIVAARWLTGEDAAREARADGELAEGETLPNDYYIDVPDPADRPSYRLAPHVRVLGSIVLERQVEHRPSTVGRLREVLMAGQRLSVWLEIDRATGEILLVEEQYRP